MIDNMRNILFVINHYPSSSETFIKDQIEYFRDKGYSVRVLCHSYSSTIEGVEFFSTRIAGSIIHRLLIYLKLLMDYRFLPMLLLTSNFLRFGRNSFNFSLPLIGSYFQRNKIDDFIYCHFGTNGKLICQLKQAGVIKKNVKILTHFHGLDLSIKKYGGNFYEILNQYCDDIVVGSDLAKSLLKELSISGKSRIHYVPVSLDLRKFPARHDYYGSVLKIITVGRLIDLKGHLDAIEVIKKFKDAGGPPFTYTIVGTGPLYDEIRSKIQEYGLEDNVKLLGAQSHSKVISMLYESDLYLYCGKADKDGRVEMQGLAVVEAMAAGCVIVTSSVGGVKEYIQNNENGIVCTQCDIDCFTKQLVLISNNIPLMRRYKESARRVAVDRFDREKNYERLIDIVNARSFSTKVSEVC